MKLCNNIHILLTALLPSCLLLPPQFGDLQPPGEKHKRKKTQCLGGHHIVFGSQFSGVQLTKAKKKLKKT